MYTDPSRHCLWDACAAEIYAAFGAVAVIVGMLTAATIPLDNSTVIPQEPTVEPGPNITITPILPQSSTVTQTTFGDNSRTIIQQPIIETPDPIMSSRNTLKPDPEATGDHSIPGEVKNYETFKQQTNPRNPNPWETEKRYDGTGDGHFNKAIQQDVPILMYMKALHGDLPYRHAKR